MSNHQAFISDGAFLDAADAAHLAGVSTRTLITAVKNGRCPGQQVGGGKWAIKAGDARNYRAATAAEQARVIEIAPKQKGLDSVTHQPATAIRQFPTADQPKPVAQPLSPERAIAKAKAELAQIEDQMTLLQVRQSELTDVIDAANKVRKYLDAV